MWVSAGLQQGGAATSRGPCREQRVHAPSACTPPLTGLLARGCAPTRPAADRTLKDPNWVWVPTPDNVKYLPPMAELQALPEAQQEQWKWAMYPGTWAGARAGGRAALRVQQHAGAASADGPAAAALSPPAGSWGVPPSRMANQPSSIFCLAENRERPSWSRLRGACYS